MKFVTRSVGGAATGVMVFTSYYCAKCILRIPCGSFNDTALQGSPRLRSGQALRLRLIFALGREDQSSLRMTKLFKLAALPRPSCRTPLPVRIRAHPGLHLFAHSSQPAEPGRESHSNMSRRLL